MALPKSMVAAAITLRERKQGDAFMDYMINQGDYQPQQFAWVPDEYVKLVLEGNAQPKRGGSYKPTGVWISGSEGWARLRGARQLFKDGRTPLKAFVDYSVRLCELGSLEDLIAVGKEVMGGLPGEILKPFDYPDGNIRSTGFFEKLQGSGYGAVHITHSGIGELGYIFYGWDVDSTVVFDPKHVRFERLRPEELQELGWTINFNIEDNSLRDNKTFIK